LLSVAPAAAGVDAAGCCLLRRLLPMAPLPAEDFTIFPPTAARYLGPSVAPTSAGVAAAGCCLLRRLLPLAPLPAAVFTADCFCRFASSPFGLCQ